MGKIFFALTFLLTSAAFAQSGEQTLAQFIYQQLSVRSGVKVAQSQIDSKESSINVQSSQSMESDRVAAIEQKQIIAHDGKLILKKDIIERVSINGIYYFKNGLVCSVAAHLNASQVYNNFSSCKLSAQCLIMRKKNASGKEITEDLNFEAQTENCNTVRRANTPSKDDEFVRDEEVPGMIQ